MSTTGAPQTPPAVAAADSSAPQTPGGGGPAAQFRRLLRGRRASDVLLLPALLVVLMVVLGANSPVFFTGRNLTQVLLQGAVLGITAVGATFVIIGGDLDLSVGSNVALSGIVAGYGMTSLTDSVSVGVVLGLGTGVLIGAINGLLSAVLDVAAFVVTLGTGVIATGLALYMTSGLTISGMPLSFRNLATTEILGLQSLIWFMIATFVVGYLVLHRMTYGTRIFASGGNREAAYLAGIAVKRVRFTAFVIAGATGGLAGVLMTSRVLAGQPGAGTSLTLFATAAVILGGTRIVGGEGSLIRTALGVLLISVVQNGLDINGVDYSLQQVVVGVVFVLAACLEVLRRRR